MNTGTPYTLNDFMMGMARLAMMEKAARQGWTGRTSRHAGGKQPSKHAAEQKARNRKISEKSRKQNRGKRMH